MAGRGSSAALQTPGEDALSSVWAVGLLSPWAVKLASFFGQWSGVREWLGLCVVRVRAPFVPVATSAVVVVGGCWTLVF